jgi:parallel beta-helix repeat protein
MRSYFTPDIVITNGVWVDARSYGEDLNDVTLQAAISAIGSDYKIVLVTPGNWVINNSITVPQNIHLQISDGATFVPAAGKKITAYSPEHIIAGERQQVVSLANNSTDPLLFTIGGKMSVFWWGAAGDGSTDDTIAIQAGVYTACNCNGNLYFPASIYVLTSTINITAMLTLSGEGEKTLFNMAAITDAAAFQAIGSVVDTSTLTVNADEGDVSVTVSDGTKFDDDDWVMLRSEATVGTAAQKKGEIVQVSSVAGGNVTFKDPINDNYSIADTATLCKLSMISGISVHGISFYGSDDDTDRHQGMYFYMCRDLTITKFRAEKTNSRGLRLVSCIDFYVGQSRFIDILGAGTQYGISVTYSSQDGLIEGCIGRNTRHVVTYGGGGTDYGIVRRVTTQHCIAHQCRDAGFDSHAGAEDVSFLNNIVHGSPVDGIIMQCSRGKIIGNTVINSYATRYGIFAQMCGSKPMDIQIHDNTVSNVTGVGRGIFVTVSQAGFTDVKAISLKNNTVNGCSTGIEVYTTEAITIPGVSIGGNEIHECTEDGIVLLKCVEFVINGNNIDFLTTKKGIETDQCIDGTIVGNSIVGSNTDTSSRGIYIKSGADISISANRVKTSNKGIFLDDASSNCAVMGNTLRGCTTPFTPGAGLGHIYATAAADPYNVV